MYAGKTRKETFSGPGESCQRNVTDLAGSLVTSSRPLSLVMTASFACLQKSPVLPFECPAVQNGSREMLVKLASCY